MKRTDQERILAAARKARRTAHEDEAAGYYNAAAKAHAAADALMVRAGRQHPTTEAPPIETSPARAGTLPEEAS